MVEKGIHLTDCVESETLWGDVDGAGQGGVGGQAAPLTHLDKRAMFLKFPPFFKIQITPVSTLVVCPGLRGCTSYTRTSPTTDSSPTEIPFQFFTFESYIYFHFLLEVFALMKISIRGRARKYERI